jgi:hypothetical protein
VDNGKLIAFCGILCSGCPAYKATQAGDDEALARIAVDWSFDDYHFEADDVRCDGCTFTDRRTARFCLECAVRECALARGVENCAHCDAFPCELLAKPWAMAVDAKTTLEDIRRALKGS